MWVATQETSAILDPDGGKMRKDATSRELSTRSDDVKYYPSSTSPLSKKKLTRPMASSLVGSRGNGRSGSLNVISV